MHQGCPWLVSVLWLGCVGAVMESAPPQDQSELTTLPPALEVEPSYTLRRAHNDQIPDYLVDGQGRALYMLIDDPIARDESACTGDCAREWPPFDLDLDQPGVALDPALAGADLLRFHRQDGPWQLRYRGHPLYLRASELSAPGSIGGDGVDGRWFVARDYDAFLIRDGALVLTDGAGRTLYLCRDDASQSSRCVGDCLAMRPPWSPRSLLCLPSVLDASAFEPFQRPDGIAQISYRGWPIYYYRGDGVPGDTGGHNQGAWRAIDPFALGSNAQP